ncbi:hypothetical protein PSN45_000584 [Yamadazyma tenuis]|uniref:Spindle pole body interacting protein n=1 Tax=Candida tenuis (strain ATCC 10573 / BCRC 21748 / CBS 615 / JCM 9827 / NBRC 10315 / NRRL Y-1498 / VKM Y-70) TaxID=590646 RepID=G3B9I0_CANTC|nr:spindle pole body interacting protein [Yamadazyma tenuis ATCC 10573]EGV61891.1 spindle pole body interacting protein [Yamadazyma tenuis ATCC 10573]WEJ93123.1 hypothetical protein PSN45_000584 [Yamadazyma tenuis]
MKNIEFIVTAEFHVDKGPSLLHQIPVSLPGLANLVFLPELMIPDQIHKRSEDYTLFLLYRNSSTGEFQYLSDAKCEPDPYFLYTLVMNVKDESVKRGSVIKALAIITKLRYFKNFKPLLMIALDSYFGSSDMGVLQNLYNAINAKSFQVHEDDKDISIIKKLLITSILDLPINDKIYYDESFRRKLFDTEDFTNPDLFIRKDLSYNSVVTFNNMNIPIKIPMIDLPDNLDDYLNPTDINFKANLIQLLGSKLSTEYLNYELTIYGLSTPSIILMINAILTGKKVILLSYDKSSGYIIDFMLTILKIVTGGGILTGLLSNYNIFPIVDVSKIDIMEQCDSFLAGTINPFFKNNESLWDVLYDLDSNEILLSKNLDEGLNRQHFQNSIIGEDAKFLSNLQLSLFNYNDDLTTIQLIFRRHINEIIRILISSKNFHDTDIGLSVAKKDQKILLLQGIGYYWNNDTSKLIEVSCYQSIVRRFNSLLYSNRFSYNLGLQNLSNELNLMIDLQYHLQKLSGLSNVQEERTIWFNMLKYLISGKSLEIFLLVTFLVPPSSSSSLQKSSLHGGNITIFDKNKGIEFLLLNLFNGDNQVKGNIVMILQELSENFLCGWCLDNYLRSNMVYEMAYAELSGQ